MYLVCWTAIYLVVRVVTKEFIIFQRKFSLLMKQYTSGFLLTRLVRGVVVHFNSAEVIQEIRQFFKVDTRQSSRAETQKCLKLELQQSVIFAYICTQTKIVVKYCTYLGFSSPAYRGFCEPARDFRYILCRQRKNNLWPLFEDIWVGWLTLRSLICILL